MKFQLFLLALFTFWTSCVPKTADARIIEDWHDQIMETHDAVMPELSTIHRLKKRIKRIESESVQEEKQSLINQLDAADESMMAWMAAYKKPKKMEPQTIEYLQEQKNDVESVDSIMMTTISKAEDFLVKHEN